MTKHSRKNNWDEDANCYPPEGEIVKVKITDAKMDYSTQYLKFTLKAEGYKPVFYAGFDLVDDSKKDQVTRMMFDRMVTSTGIQEYELDWIVDHGDNPLPFINKYGYVSVRHQHKKDTTWCNVLSWYPAKD